MASRKVNLWGSPDPLCLVLLNVNHSQSRKSRLTNLAEDCIGHADKHCMKRNRLVFEAKAVFLKDLEKAKKRRAGGDGVGVQDADTLPAQGAADEQTEPSYPSFPGIWSLAFLGGTIERVRERCAGDYSLVRQTKIVQKLPALSPEWVRRELSDLDEAEKALATSAGMQGRIWFGQALVYDEVYQFLQDLSILDKPNEKKASDGPGSGQTPLAGWFNRLAQCGKSDHETKSNGSHGGRDCLPVSTTIVGNFHPTPAIEMLRGDRGDHGCQAKARLLVCTGLPVQPREQYEEIEGLPSRSNWVPVPKTIWGSIGCGRAFVSATAFKSHFMPGDEGEDEGEDEESSIPEYVPSVHGVTHTLPDGVDVPVRMKYEQGVYVPQWNLPKRDIEIPDRLNLCKRAEVLVEHCSQKGPH